MLAWLAEFRKPLFHYANDELWMIKDVSESETCLYEPRNSQFYYL
jgi:hypothetical protein